MCDSLDAFAQKSRPVQIMKQECGSFSSWNLGCVEILQILLPKWSL